MRIHLGRIHLLAGRKPVDWMMDLSVPAEWDYEASEPSLSVLLSSLAEPFLKGMAAVGPLINAYKGPFEWAADAELPTDHNPDHWESIFKVYGLDLTRGGSIVSALRNREDHVHISPTRAGSSPYRLRGWLDELDEETADRAVVAEEIALENGTTILESAKLGIVLPRIKKNNGPPKKRMR